MNNDRFEFENGETDDRLSKLISLALGPDDQTDAEIERLLAAVVADPLPDETVAKILDRANISADGQGSAATQLVKRMTLPPVARTEASSTVKPQGGAPGSDVEPRVRLVTMSQGSSSGPPTTVGIGAGAATAVLVSAVCLVVAICVQPDTKPIPLAGNTGTGTGIATSALTFPSNFGAGAMVRASILPSPAWFETMQRQATRLVASAIPPSGPIARAKVGDTIETGQFEKRRVNLPDGSVLYVNADTKLRVEDARRIKVEQGEVFVEVVPDFGGDEDKAAATHFVVQTATNEVKALGTKFAVNTQANDVDVTVTQGSVVDVGGNIATAGQTMHLPFRDDALIEVSARASHALNWTEELMTAAAVAIVPRSENLGGRLMGRPQQQPGQPVTVDTAGQDMQLSLRKYHVDVHIQDGFARTTIDQTYFNDTWQRLEGTFYFPLPPDASLSRLAMYVGEKLMEGGMAERDHARNVYEEIRHTKRDPALLEWVDGSTFKMRVFPLEARQEKRLVLSYTQRLNSAYGRTNYRFPAGHNMNIVRDWSTKIVVKDGADRDWSSSSHDMQAETTARDLILTAAETASTMQRDVVVELNDDWVVGKQSGRKSMNRTQLTRTVHDDHQYFMVRHRPKLDVGRIKPFGADPAANAGDDQRKEQGEGVLAQRAGSAPKGLIRPTRDWIVVFESSGDRDPVLARTQIEVVRTFLTNAEHTDRFSIVLAGAKARLWKPEAVECSGENVAAAIAALEDTQLIGALDLEAALRCVGQVSNLPRQGGGRNAAKRKGAAKLKEAANLKDAAADGQVGNLPHVGETVVVHVGSGLPVLGDTQENELEKLLPADVRYVGLAIGKRWSRQFMKQAASKTGGYFTQINPDEKVAWRAFEAFSILNAPRLLNINVADKANKQRFRTWTESIADGEEVCAITRLGKNEPLPKAIVIKGEANGQAWKVNIPVEEDSIADQADYLPRSWAKLEIDRLVAEGAATNKQAIVDLSKAMYVMSPFTSLLVLENEEMYKQYNVDRGRKDHWALYPCPETIKVVYEPNGRTQKQATGLGLPEATLPKGPLTFSEAMSSVLPRRSRSPGSQVYYRTETVTRMVPARRTRRVPRKVWHKVKKNVTQADGSVVEKMVDVAHTVYDTQSYSVQIPQVEEVKVPYTLNRNGRASRLSENTWTFWDDGLAWEDRFASPPINRLFGRSRRYAAFGEPLGETRYDNFFMKLDKDNDGDGVPDSIWLDLDRSLVSANSSTSYFGQANGLVDFSRHENLYRGFDDLNDQWFIPVDKFAQNRFDFSYPDSPNLFLGYRQQGINEDSLRFRAVIPSFVVPDFDDEYIVNLPKDFTDPTSVRTVFSTMSNLQTYRLQIPSIQQQFAGTSAWGIDGYIVNGDAELLQYGIPMNPPVLVPGEWSQVELEQRSTRADRYLSTLRQVRLSDGEFPDEPPIRFPTADEWKAMMGRQRRRATVNTTPVRTIGRQVFGDLVAYAPGMQVSQIDILSVLESDTETRVVKQGSIDPAARRLIEAGRAVGWEQVRLPGESGLTIRLAGDGRYGWDRILPHGLNESVRCDGEFLWHMYEELGLGSKRINSRFHQAELRRMIPWLLAPVEELAANANVTLIDQRTVVVTPVVQKTDDDHDVKVVKLLLVFNTSNQLIEKRYELDGDVVSKQTFDADGSVKVYGSDGDLLVGYRLQRTRCDAVDFAKVQRGGGVAGGAQGPAGAGGTRSVPATLVVPMPYRSVAAVKRAYQDAGRPVKDWDEETALAMLGAYIGESKPAEAVTLLQERFFDQGDRRIGLTVLLATRFPQAMYNGQTTAKGTARGTDAIDLRPDAEHSPLAQFVRQYLTWNATGDDNREFAIDGDAHGFVQRMATARNLYYRWKNGLATKDRTTNQIKAELETVLKFIATCEDSLGWQLIRVVQPTVTDPKLNELLAVAAEMFTDSPQLEWLAKSARIRALFVAGKYGKARQEYRDLLFASLKAGQMPIIENDLLKQFRDRGNGPHLWRNLVRDMQDYAIEHRLLRTAVNLSIRLRQLKFEDQADKMLSAALKELDVAKRPDVAGLAIGHLRGLERFAEADKLMSPLLELPYLQYDARVWRYASDISDKHGQKKEALERLERALAVEFQFRPNVIDLQKLRADYGNLLSKYEAVIEASKTLGQDPPKDMIARIVAATDRWRMLDDNDTPSCQAAAKLLTKLKDRERAWDYLTTPLATNPGDSQTWVVMGRHLRGDGDFDQAHTAFAKAFSFEKTNPDILLEHARSLRKHGESAEAKTLFEQISRSDWQPRFANTKKEAQRVLTEL